MKRIISMLVCCFVFAGVQAQKITRDYNNVSLSEALRQLNEQTEDYTISFLYNELEDFRITTSIHRKSVPDAIRQMIGFYPIRMTVEPGIAHPSQQEIIVECPQKTALRYKGTVIDEQGQPVAYANIALLSPQDSTLITGGVSNESGYFAIPYEQPTVLARISYVGYKTIYKQFSQSEVGIIRMEPDSHTLKGVTVKGNYIVAKGNKMIINVPDNIKKNTFDGYATLSALTIPGLHIDPIEYTVTSNIGEVLLCINGREVEANEVRALNPNDIKRIDYYQNFDPNHPAASSVIDFIMINRDSGGLVYGYARHHLNIGKGDGIVDLKHYRKNSELNFQISGDYGHYMLDRGEESTTNMTFNTGDVVKTSEVKNSPLHSNRFKGKASWLWQGKKDMFQIAAYLSKSHDVNDQNILQTYSTLNDVILTEDYTHKDIISPAAQIYYQRRITKDGLLRTSIYGNYSHTDKNRCYNSRSSFMAHTREDLYRIRPDVLVGLTFGKNRPFFSATYDYKSTRNEYTENGNESNNKLSYGNGQFMIGNNFIFSKKFRLTLRLAENVLSVDNGKNAWTKFFFSPSILYNADFGRGNTMRGEFYTYVNDPQMTYYNGSSQKMDQYQILRGNPELKNGHCIGVESVFDSNHKWGMFELLTQYINMPKYIYEDVFADNDNAVFVHTYRNGRSYNHFLLNADIRLNVIPKKLIWMVAGEYNLFKDGGNRISEFVGGTDLTYMDKNFIGKIEFVSPLRYLAKGVEYEKPTSLKISLRYTLNRFQLGFYATNPFMHSCVKTTYTTDNYSNVAKTYSPRLASNMFMFTFAYRMSYGKKHKFQDIEMDDSQSSGLLEQQSIRNEKMETGKK